MRWTILVGMLAVASCRSTQPAPREPEPSVETARRDNPTARPRVEPPAVIIHPRGGGPEVVVRVEVARTPSVRERGLMHRQDMAEDHGMIFVFPEPSHQVFWMHNTILPLDMIFIRSDRTILGIVRNATPETDDSRQVEGISQYVLEVNGGWSDRHHVGPGDRVEFIGIPPALE